MADGDYDEDSIHRPPPAPDDRLWRHPSELGWLPDAPSPPARRSWLVNALSAAGGALVIGTFWMASGSSSTVRIVTQRVASVPIESVAPRVTSAEQWSDEVTLAARPSTALVRTMEGTQTLAGAVAVRDDGYLITSARALGDHTTVMIHTSDGLVVDASVVGYDPVTDISVLKVDTDIAPALIAASPADDGDIVALVNPSGESRRQVVVEQASASTAIDGDRLLGFLTLDATIGDLPPGSPVVDHSGAVIGITASTDEGSPVTVVPIALASRIAAQLIANGTATHPRLGVTARDLAPSDDAATAGSYVTSIDLDGPAERGGVLPDDVIIEIAGREVQSMADMVASLRRHDPGDLVEVLVQRQSVLVSCQVTLGTGTAGDS